MSDQAGSGARTSPSESVCVVILTHNALRYCAITLRSLWRTRDVEFEVVVVDNRSRLPTRLFLVWQAFRGRIHKLALLHKNSLFAKGNNYGVGLADPECTHVLLLNSDVEIRDPAWLAKLLKQHRRGATSLGKVEIPLPRGDGYCFLIDMDLYRQFRLDESYEWWWSVTRLQAELLQNGHSVQAVEDHDDLIYHFGGKSGTAFVGARGMDESAERIGEWFGANRVTILPRLGE